MAKGIWTVAEAKAKFSALVAQTRTDGPQTITRNGRTTAVMVAAEDWERVTHRQGTLADFFAASPLKDSGLAVKRAKDRPRKLAL